MSRVDVIVPCYNYGRYLRECVRSLTSQPEVEVRVLIIDDCSRDDTLQVAAELKTTASCIEYRRHSRNIGHIATYNEGLEWASGDYVLLISADDALVPGALARAAKVMDQHPEVALTYGRMVQSEHMPSFPPFSTTCDWTMLTGQELLEDCCKAGYNTIPTPTAVVRTAIQKKVGGYRSQFPHAGDMEMWLRLGMYGSVAHLHVEQAFKREHNKNMFLEYRGWEDVQQVNEVFQGIFLEFADRILDLPKWRRIADHALAWKALEEAYSSFARGDVASCRRLLHLALEKNPTLGSHKEWKKLRWKLRIGFRTWSFVGPIFRRLRGKRLAFGDSSQAFAHQLLEHTSNGTHP
jgi:glycosyltransferase involved in cell wall biosynthesis